MSILNRFFHRVMKSRNAIKYWRKRGVKIGNDCEIYSSADFGSEPYLIKIGDHVRITGGVRFITHDGGVWVLRNKGTKLVDADLFGCITVGNNVHIGSNAIIMPNVKIGNNVIVGCGAIVTKDIPNDSIAVGVPARVIESIEEYEEKHKENFVHTKFLSAKEKRRFIEGRFYANKK